MLLPTAARTRSASVSAAHNKLDIAAHDKMPVSNSRLKDFISFPSPPPEVAGRSQCYHACGPDAKRSRPSSPLGVMSAPAASRALTVSASDVIRAGGLHQRRIAHGVARLDVGALIDERSHDAGARPGQTPWSKRCPLLFELTLSPACRFTSAPWSSRNRTASCLRDRTAAISAVRPFLRLSLTSAPAPIRTRIDSRVAGPSRFHQRSHAPHVLDMGIGAPPRAGPRRHPPAPGRRAAISNAVRPS